MSDFPIPRRTPARPARRRSAPHCRQRLGHNYIGTEHLLLALLELEDGSGPLSEVGLTKPAVEAFVAETLSSMRG